MLEDIDLRKELLDIQEKYKNELKNVLTKKEAIKFAKTWEISSIYESKSKYITVDKDNFEKYLNIDLKDIEVKLDGSFLYIEEVDIEEKYSDYSISDAFFEISNNKILVTELELEKRYKNFSFNNFNFITERHLKTFIHNICTKYELMYPSCDKIQLFLDNDIDQETFIRACSKSC